MSLNIQQCYNWLDNFTKDKSNTIIQNALSNNKLDNLIVNNKVLRENNFFFNTEVKPIAKITDQKSSGRCWLFATLNMIRPVVLKDFNLDDFEFSENYLFFWDKMEKMNCWIDLCCNMKFDSNKENGEVNERKIQALLSLGICDGGYWIYAANLIKKYGLMPKKCFPESYHSKRSVELKKILNLIFRDAVCALFKIEDESKRQEEKDRVLKLTFSILCKFLGTPPKTFTWEYKTKSGTDILENITPIDFYKKINFNIDDYVPLMDKLYREKHELLEFENGHNMHGTKAQFLTVENDRLKELAFTSIKNNEVLYFSCDVRKEHYSDAGYMDLLQMDYEGTLGFNIKLTKNERVKCRQSCPTHAMAFVGAHKVKGKITRWKVENSWGKSGDNDGYLMMTNDWFTEYVYGLVVNKKYLNDDEKEALNKKSVLLPQWDPLVVFKE